MIVSGIIDPERKGSSLAGKPYTFDLDLDVFHVKIGAADAAYSDYVPFDDRYMIVDFDRDQRVVGYTVEGALDAYKRQSLKARLLLPIQLQWAGAQYVSRRVLGPVLRRVVNRLPTPDARGKLPVPMCSIPL